MTDTLSVGTRIRLTQDVERYPHFIAPKGATGIVTEIHPDLVSVRMDETVLGAEEWDNEVHWYPQDGGDILADAEILSA